MIITPLSLVMCCISIYNFCIGLAKLFGTVGLKVDISRYNNKNAYRYKAIVEFFFCIPFEHKLPSFTLDSVGIKNVSWFNTIHSSEGTCSENMKTMLIYYKQRSGKIKNNKCLHTRPPLNVGPLATVCNLL